MSYRTDEETIDLIRNWWKEYGTTLLFGILLAIAGVVGYKMWTNHQNSTRDEASSGYQYLLSEYAAGKTDSIKVQAEHLKKDYAKTPYASLAALLLAKQQVEENHYDGALAQLNWVITHGKVAAFRQVARLRAARLLITQKKIEEAIVLLAKVDDKTYAPLIAEIKGDALAAKGDKAEAHKAYVVALQAMPQRPLLQMRANNL